MGGNAFKHIDVSQPERFGLSEFGDAFSKVKGVVSQFGMKCDFIPYIRDKTDFGDLDVVVEKPSGTTTPDLITREIMKEIGEVVVKNSNVHSVLTKPIFGGKPIQIDLIYTKAKYYNSSLTYYAWNDFGALMGRIAHCRGLKYGHDGLSLRLWKEGIEDIHLTSDTEKIFSFMAWDYKRFLEGFNTLGEMFQYTASLSGFNGRSYQYEELDHKNRTRNRKRINYNAFVDWLEKTGINMVNAQNDKSYWKLHALAYFGKQSVYDELKRKKEEAEDIKKKFNGNLVRDWTGLDGEPLGSFICKYLIHIGNKSVLLDKEPIEIETEVKEFFRRITNV